MIDTERNCTLAAHTKLTEGEGHSKIEKYLVKNYYGKLNMFKIFQTWAVNIDWLCTHR